MSSDDLVERLRCNPVWAEPAETQRRELVMAEAADRIEALESEVAWRRAAMEWRPIESAPRDGTNIMLWHKVWRCPVSAFYGETYRKDCPWTQTTNTTIWPEEAFTHWMPLLAAPEGE